MAYGRRYSEHALWLDYDPNLVSERLKHYADHFRDTNPQYAMELDEMSQQVLVENWRVRECAAKVVECAEEVAQEEEEYG